MKHIGYPLVQTDWSQDYKKSVMEGTLKGDVGFAITATGVSRKLVSKTKPKRVRLRELDMFEQNLIKESVDWL